jgi:hypothetical protein
MCIVQWETDVPGLGTVAKLTRKPNFHDRPTPCGTVLLKKLLSLMSSDVKYTENTPIPSNSLTSIKNPEYQIEIHITAGKRRINENQTRDIEPPITYFRVTNTPTFGVIQINQSTKTEYA